MPNYKYTAIDSNGKQSGNIEADNTKHAISLLKEQGLKVVSIEEGKQAGKGLNTEIKFFEKKVKTKDLSIFCRQLHTMLTSGMPITRTLEVLASQSEKPILQETSMQVSLDIRKGNLLSDALRMHPKVFPPLLVNMIEAGELTGNLDSVVDSLAKHYENEARINSKIRQALMYPKVLAFLSMVVVICMLTFVVPKFLELFLQSDTPVPAITQVLINMSNFAKNNFILLTLIIIGINIAYKKAMQIHEVKHYVQLKILGIPKIGITVKKLVSTRFCRTMATLLTSGIPIVNALEASAKVTGNLVLSDKMNVVVDEIRKGNSLSYFLNETNIFPPIVISMISIGEESGDLVGMFNKVADYFDAELDENIKKITGIIEPVVLIIMGLILGFMIVAMYLPIMQLSTTIK